MRLNRCRWRHGYYWQPIGCCHRPIRGYHRRLSTTYRLATIPHDWHTIVRYNPLRSSKVKYSHVIWKGVCNFLLVINGNLGLISHRFRHMDSFPSNFLPRPFNPQFEIVPLAVDNWNFACQSFAHMANYLCKKFSPTS